MGAWLERWKRLSRKERAGLAGLAALSLGVWFYQTLYRPQAVRLQKARSAWVVLRRQVDLVRADLPKPQETRLKLEREEAEIVQFRGELKSQESLFPSRASLGTLLGALAKQGEGLQMEFQGIKQQIKEDPEYPEVAIDIGMKTSFEDLVTYLRRVEQFSPYLRVGRLEASEPKKGSNKGPKAEAEVHLVLVSPLSHALPSESLDLIRAMPPVPKAELPRSPFASRARPPDDSDLKKEIKVTGITWRGPASTAIVNDEVVRTGDHVGHLTVKQILPDMVIFSDGFESHAVALEQG